MYYEDFHHTSPSPAPSQTADVFVPMESRDATPTPLTAHPPSPASVTEISRDEFPPLAVPVPATVTKPRAKTTKANKGKAKAKAAAATAAGPTSDNDDPFLAADIAATTAASLGLPSQRDDTTEGASTSRRPAADPGSPSKRRRSNMAGDTSPAPAPTTAATHQVATYVAAPIEAPATLLRPLQPSLLHPLLRPPFPPLPLPPLPRPPSPRPAAAAAATPIAAAAAALAARPSLPQLAAPAVAPAAAPAAAPALPPLWLTADALPPRGSYTPTPAGGFPPHWVPADLIRMYEEVSSPKFFLVVSGDNGAVMRTHGLIREAIANYINIDPTTFTLGTPPTAANGSSPTLWLAADIPDPLAQGIVDARILSSTNITLYTLPYNMPVIGFDLIGTAVQANNKISQFVQTHRDAFGPQVSSGEAWGAFLASITVHGIVLIVNETNTVAWRLHITPPTNNRDSWSQLRRLFGKLQIMTALYGTARLQRAFKCRICPSIDHPTPLCPLPDLPGWLGPTPTTIAALEDASCAAASKAQEQMRIDTADGAGGSNVRPGTGQGQGSFDGKARRGGKAKRGGDFKGKGKRRERDNFL
ncbi:hypothetical protein B0H14DRAFT_2567551 [Mycena olivaceomarginata]|nr:hypothetical protein B0H14DRAFT_2567551 [Mycena olivaceomarginata]